MGDQYSVILDLFSIYLFLLLFKVLLGISRANSTEKFSQIAGQQGDDQTHARFARN